MDIFEFERNDGSLLLGIINELISKCENNTDSDLFDSYHLERLGKLKKLAYSIRNSALLKSELGADECVIITVS